MLVARRTAVLALLGFLVMPAHAENELSRLHKVQVAPEEAEVAVRIFGSRAPDFTSFTMQNPFRVVVDWAGSALDGVADRQDFKRGVVRRIETQQFESEAERISRVTITLAQPVQFRFETAGKEVRVRFEQVADLPTVPEAEPAPAAPLPEPEDEPPPPDDPVLAELKKQTLPEGPLFEPAEPPAPPPPPVVAAVPPPPPVVAAVPPPPPPAPVIVAAAATPPPAAKIAAPVRVEVPPAAPAPAPVGPPARSEPALSPVASRSVETSPAPAPLARAAQVKAPPSREVPSAPVVVAPTPAMPAPVVAKAEVPKAEVPKAEASKPAEPGKSAPESAPLARFQPPAPAEPVASAKAEATPLARFAPPPAAPPVAPAPAPAAPAPAPRPAEPPVVARAPERAPPAPEVPPLPVVRAEPRPASPPVATRAPEPTPPARPHYKRFGDGFEVIQTGRGTVSGQGGRVIEPFQISRAPSRAPAPARASSARAVESYSAASPSFYAQSAAQGAAKGASKEVIDGGEDFEPGPREMRMIGFQQKPDKAAVYVRCDAKAKFRVERVSDTGVVLKLFDTKVPLENNKRPLDTSFFESSVVGVQATEVGADTHVEVKLRGPVPFEVKRIGSYLYLYFSKS